MLLSDSGIVISSHIYSSPDIKARLYNNMTGLNCHYTIVVLPSIMTLLDVAEQLYTRGEQ